MDYDDDDSQGHNLAGEGTSKSSPVSRPFTLPKFDFDDSLQGHLRFESLVDNEVFLGISSQENSQWIEDFSRGNSGIEFSSRATEPCSISRRNNVWSEATSSESVAMLLKSVGQEERIQGETIIEESDAGNELGRLTTEMEPNLKHDDKMDDIINSQPTALPDSFLDERNVTLESRNDNLPVNGSSGGVSNVPSVIMSEADPGSDKKCDDTNQLEVNNVEQPQVDNLEGCSPEMHVQNATSMLPSDIVSSNELNGQENEHRVTNACFETVDGLLKDIPIMAEQNLCTTESTVVNQISSRTGSAICTGDVQYPHRVVSNSESLEQHKAETNITNTSEPSKLQEKVACNLQNDEVCKIDKGSAGPSQGNVEVRGCHEGEKNCKPLQDSLHDSSVACLDEYTTEVVNKKAVSSDFAAVEVSIVEEKENSCGSQVNSLKNQNVEVVDMKTGNPSCPEHDLDIIVENEKFENHVGGAVVAEASLLPDVDRSLAEQAGGSGIKHVENPDTSLSCTVSGLQCEKKLSTEDLSNMETSIVPQDNNTPEAQTSSPVVGGHVQRSKNNISSEQDDVHSFGKDVSLHEREDAKSLTASLSPDEFCKKSLVHGSECFKSAISGPGSKLTEETHLSSCDMLTDLPLRSGTKTTADGVTLCEQGRKPQVANLLGITNSPQVATDLELSSLPKSGLASWKGQEAGPGCSTKVEAFPVLNSSDIKLVDDTEAAECQGNKEISMERNAEVALAVVADAVLPSSQSVVPPESVSVSMVESCNMIQKDHEIIVTSATQSTKIPSTKVDLLEKNQASFALACPSKCTEDSANKDGDASANSFEDNVDPPSVISCVNTLLSENEQQTRTKEVLVGSVQHPEATHGAGRMVQSVSLHMQHDSSNNGESSSFENVKEYQSEGNPGLPSVVSCANILPSETGQKSRAEDASVATVQHSEETPDADGKVQSAALHIELDNSNEEKIISIEVSSSIGLSESEVVKGSPSCPRIPVNIISTSVEGYPLASDCSQLDLTMVPKHPHESSEGPGPMPGKKRAGAKGTSERKTRQGSAKASARASAKKRGVQETPVKQFEGDKSTMILSSPGTSNPERSGIKASGALLAPMSNIPDLNTSVSPAFLQQPFTDPQQVQLRAQILVHGSLMQNSVPEEACMISAFGPLDGGGCLWEPAWRACNERIHAQKSHASNLETPVRSRSGSRGVDQPVKNSSLQSEKPLPAGGASSKGLPSPVNPVIPLSSPLWNVSAPCDSLQSSGTFVDFHQPFAPPLQPYQAQGARGFVEQSSSWLSQTHFSGQWATPQTSAQDVNVRASLMSCTEPVALTPAKASYMPNHPAIKQATHVSVSAGGGDAAVSSGNPSQSDVNKAPIPSDPNSVNPKHKRKKVSVSKSPGHIPPLTLDKAASVTDTSNHPSEKATALQAVFQNSLLAQSLPESGSPVVNNVSSMPNVATATFFASTSNPGNYLAAVSPLIFSDQPIKVDQIVEKSRISEETLNEVEAAKLQAEDAAAHAAVAVGKCNDVWSQLSKMKNFGSRFDDETKLSSAAMAIAAAASVAKAAAAAAKLASNVAIGAKLMADEVSTTSVTKNNTHSTEISLSHSSNSSVLAGEGIVSARSIIAAAKETVKKRVEAATAASKHAENLDAMVKVAELAAEAVSQAGKIVSIGDALPLSELVSSGPMNYWRTPEVSPEQVEMSRIDQRDTFNAEKLVPAEPPEDGAIIMGEAVNPGTVTSIGKNSSTSQRTNSEVVASRDARSTALDTSFENGMVEGSLVEVFKEGGKFKAAWYLAKVLTLNDGTAFVSYTELQADNGSGKLKEWVPLKGDGFKAPTIRIPHPTTSICFDRTRKRRRAAVMDYTWCVGDRVDAWMQDCWFEGVVKEKNKNDETTLTVYIPALGGISAVKTWHLRPSVTWKDGKWIEWPTAIQQSATQGDTPQEKRVKLGHSGVEATEDKISRGIDLVESKEHEESRPLPLLANETEFNIGNNTGDLELDASRIVRTGLQKEGSRVVFGVPKPGKKRKLMEVSKHLGSDRSIKNTKTSDSVKTARYLPQGSGSRSWNTNSNVNIKEKQAAEDKPKVYRSGKPQSVSGRVLLQKINSSVSAKSTRKTVSKEENNSAEQNLMEFCAVSDSQDTSEGPTSSKGLPRVPGRRVPSSKTKSVQLNKGKRAAAGGELGKKVEQDNFFPHVAEPRRSSRKIQPTSRLLEGLQSSLIGSKMPSVLH